MSNNETIIIALITLFGTLIAQFIPALKEWPKYVQEQRIIYRQSKANEMSELERSRASFWQMNGVANNAIAFAQKVTIQCTEIGERYTDQIQKIEDEYNRVLSDYINPTKPKS